MKSTTLLSTLILMLGSFMLLPSCTNGSSDDNNTNNTPIQNQVQTGNWKITEFIDSGKDETNHFTGYIFTFAANGTLTATNGNNIQTGTWAVTDSNSQDDSPGSPDFVIQFNVTNDFSDLNEDWTIIAKTDTRIELKHVSGGKGGTDFLTIEKI